MLSANHVIIGDREIPGGTRVFRGPRVPFQAWVDHYLEGGHTPDEFPDDFPTASGEAPPQALEHVKALCVGEPG